MKRHVHMGAVREPGDVVEEDLAPPLPEDELERGDRDYGKDSAPVGGCKFGIAGDSAVDHGDAGEVASVLDGLREVDFAAAVDIDDASVADPHLSGDVEGSDSRGRVPEDVDALLGRGE